MRTEPSVVAAAVLLVLMGIGAGREANAAPSQARQRPPEEFTCPRNDLTVYTGLVTRYERARGRTTLRIRTDWDTTENVTLTHAGSDDASASYRYMGKPFTAADWVRIERSKGVLRAGTRAAAWVCTDGKVMVDWGVPKELSARPDRRERALVARHANELPDAIRSLFRDR